MRRNSARSVEGVTFDRCHPSTPLCCPSRSTCLSGQFAHNNGVRHNKGADFTVRLPS